ncbi:MAG: hypothetical protein M1281_08745 [Chloroflexi bacterium]|nr:hypothetical protein [Chloroflexota bacterium]
MNFVSLISTLITFVFIIALLRRYARKGGTYLLVWSVGFLFYGLGTLSEVILSQTFSGTMLKIWYLSGAMLTAAWLGQGTIFLLVRRGSLARILAVVLGIVSLISIALLFAAPLTSAAAAYQTNQPISSQYQAILTRSTGIIVLTILLNIYGTIALVGGAIFSGYLFWRKRVLLNRVVGNILIAAGALAPAMAGSFIKAGLVDMLYISELVGVLVMYLGFLQATASAAPKTAISQPSD